MERDHLFESTSHLASVSSVPVQASQTQDVSLNWGVQCFERGGCHEHEGVHRDEAFQHAVGMLSTGHPTPLLQGIEPDAFSVFLQIAVCKDVFAQIFSIFFFLFFTSVFCFLLVLIDFFFS